MKYSLFLLFLLNISVYSQNKLQYNSKGELSDSDYQSLLSKTKYQAISAFDTVSLKPLLIYSIYIKNGKLGILDNNSTEITPAIYDNIAGLNISYTTVMFGFHDLYPVQIGKKYGLITNKGKAILPVKYNYIHAEPFKSKKESKRKEVVKDSVIIASLNNEELLFTPSGKIITKKKEESILVEEGMKNDYSYRDSAPQKTEYEKTSFGTILKKTTNGYAIIQNKVDNKYYYQGLEELASHKLILPLEYSYLNFDRFQRIIGVKNKENYLFDENGKPLFNEPFQGIEEFNGIYKIKKNNKTALFDKDLKPLTEFIFDTFSSANGEMLVATKNGKYGAITLNGKEEVAFKYDNLEMFFKRNETGVAFFKAKLDGKTGIVSKNGTLLSEIIYDDIIPECTIERGSYSSEPLMPIDHDYDSKNAYFIIKNNQKIGLLDNNFKPLIPIEYDILDKSYHDDFVFIGKRENNRTLLAIVNIRTNKQVTPYEFQSIKYLNNNYFSIYKDSKYGICDSDGNIIIPMQYSNEFYVDTIFKGLHTISNRAKKILVDYKNTLVTAEPESNN